MIVGNDVSSYQNEIDFDTYVKNSNFIITKATEGNGFTDARLRRNQSEARRVGLPLGYYHFARPDLNNTPQQEADYFLKQIGDLREGEILCLDYEANWNGDVVAWCSGFLDYCRTKTGIKPLIYLNKTLVRKYNWQMVAGNGYGLWLACYDNNLITGQWAQVTTQQWGSNQQVPGIAGNVDGNYFFGTVDQFKAYGYHTPVTPPQPVPPAQDTIADEKAAVVVLHDVVAHVTDPVDPSGNKLMFQKLESAARWIPDAVQRIGNLETQLKDCKNTAPTEPVFTSQLAQLLYKAAKALG